MERRRSSDEPGPRRSGWVVRVAMGLAALAMAGAFAAGGVAFDRAFHTTETNRDAIVRSCDVLNFAIQHSTPKPVAGRGPTPAQLYVAALVRTMTPDARRQLAQAIREYPPLGPANCKLVVNDARDPFRK